MATKNENFWFSLLGAAVTIYVGSEKAKANNREYTFEDVVGNGILGVTGGLAFSKLVGEPHDTVNYTGYKGKRRVYEGIVFEDRLDKRITEHKRNGKRFSHVVFDEAKPRSEARELEKKRIWKFQPEWNIHHNS